MVVHWNWPTEDPKMLNVFEALGGKSKGKVRLCVTDTSARGMLAINMIYMKDEHLTVHKWACEISGAFCDSMGTNDEEK